MLQGRACPQRAAAGLRIALTASDVEEFNALLTGDCCLAFVLGLIHTGQGSFRWTDVFWVHSRVFFFVV